MNHSRSTATLAPPISTVPVGSIAVRGRASVPYFSASAACRVSMMPTAAMTLASTGALRSGREIASWTTAPSTAATPKAMRMRTQVGTSMSMDGIHGNGSVSFPASRSLYTYSGTVAITAAAKLMTPVPWYVRTMPIANEA